MNSAFLSSELSRNLEFRLNFECTINGITQESIYHESLRRSGIKVDTGAHGILIPLKTLGWLQSDIDLLVEWYLMNDRSSFTVIHGVESSNKITNA